MALQPWKYYLPTLDALTLWFNIFDNTTYNDKEKHYSASRKPKYIRSGPYMICTYDKSSINIDISLFVLWFLELQVWKVLVQTVGRVFTFLINRTTLAALIKGWHGTCSRDNIKLSLFLCYILACNKTESPGGT